MCRATPAEMGAAGPGRLRYRVSVETPALRFVPPGTYALTLEWGEHQWIGREEGDQQVAEVELGPTLTPRPAQARVRTARGEPELLVNGRPLFPSRSCVHRDAWEFASRVATSTVCHAVRQSGGGGFRPNRA